MVKSPGRVRAVTLLGVVVAVLFSVAICQAQASATAVPDRGARLPATPGETLVKTEAWVSAEATYLSGRDVNVVCVLTAQDWAQALAGVGLPPEPDEYYGFSLIGEGEMHLSPYVCEGLRLGLLRSTRRSNALQVAWSVDVLVHESVHLGRFTVDEALAEGCARVGLPAELHRLYGISYHSGEMSRLTFAAAAFRGTQDPAYQGGTCTALAG